MNRCGVLLKPLSIYNPKYSKGLTCHYTLGTGTSLSFFRSNAHWVSIPRITKG